jgi:hypothetical protein
LARSFGGACVMRGGITTWLYAKVKPERICSAYL